MLWRKDASVRNNVAIIKHTSYTENGKGFGRKRKKFSHCTEFLMEKLTLNRLSIEGVCVNTTNWHFCIFIEHCSWLQNKYFSVSSCATENKWSKLARLPKEITASTSLEHLCQTMPASARFPCNSVLGGSSTVCPTLPMRKLRMALG